MERKDTILVTCSRQESRKYMRFVLEERFHILEATGIQQMLALLEQNTESIVTVVIGTSIMDAAGKQLLQEKQAEEMLMQFPIVILNENNDPKDVPTMYRYGATDVIDLNYDAYATLHRIDTVAQLHMHQQHLESLIQERSEILRQSNDTMVDVLSSIIEYRSAESGHHVLRIRNFVRILLEEVMQRCPEYRLTKREVAMISSASALHDVGKIAIPDAILTKPGPLTASEWEIMKTHSATGCQILEALGGMADQEYLNYAKNICRYHHERWDGSGYPEGLSGDQIPICAQVVGLADAYEALTGERSYKSRFTFDQAINMILKGECGAFSPKLLACLKNVTEAYEALTVAYADGNEPELVCDMALPAPETDISALERTQAMYYSLVHYINGFLMEVNLDQELFHVIYNPYPDMAQLEGITKLSELVELMLDGIVVPEERDQMAQVLFTGIPRFVEENLRRTTYSFHYRELEKGQKGRFEMTLLRNSVSGSNRRSLLILVRKLEEWGEKPAYTTAWYSLAESTYICRNDQYFTLVSLDHEASGLGGYSRQELFEDFQGQLIQILHPDDRERVRREVVCQLKEGTEVRMEHRVVMKNGEIRWVTNKSRLAVGPDGQENLHCFLTDINQTRTALENMEQKLDRYITVMGKTDNVFFDWNLKSDMMEFSDTWQEVFGGSESKGNVRRWLMESSVIHPDDVPLLMDKVINMENGSEQETQEIRVSTDRGRYIWCRVQGHANRDDRGNLIRVLGMITNIEAEKQKERALKDRAERDSLTKLLNKDAGRRKITAYLGHYLYGTSCAMLIIDLDDFKQVNDNYGHLFGDAVLTKVAQEIKRQFNGQDIVCRIGGDEFMVLVRGLADRQLLEIRCNRLISSFCDSLRAQHKDLKISCSIGIALSPEHGKTYYDLFNHADIALYRAKAMGKNTYSFYDGAQEAFSPVVKGISSISNRIDSDEEPGLAEDNIVRHAFTLLYSASDMKAAVDEVISYLGRRMNVSRVYIFENSEDNQYCSNTFEWCNEGIEPQMDQLQNVSYLEDIPNYEENFDEQGVFYVPNVSELDQHLRDILEPQGILSMLHCAMRPDGVFSGYIGFDDCVRHRLWTREEIRMLTYFTEMLSMFLMKTRRQEKLARQAQDIMTILENQDTYIYIIDPDTWQIQYMNKAAKGYFPDAKVGKVCYQCIQGNEGPCENCPSLNIQKNKVTRRVIRSPFQPSQLLLEATLIQWKGKNACLMTCRVLPECE